VSAAMDLRKSKRSARIRELALAGGVTPRAVNKYIACGHSLDEAAELYRDARRGYLIGGEVFSSAELADAAGFSRRGMVKRLRRMTASEALLRERMK
jgi:hypothetical protein